MITIAEGTIKLPGFFSFIRVAWKIQSENGNLEFLIEGHKVLTLMGWANIPSSGVFKLPFLTFIRLKWEVKYLFGNIEFFLEGKHIFSINTVQATSLRLFTR